MDNPYLTPQTIALAQPPVISPAAALRASCLRRETSIKVIGGLRMFGGGLGIVATLFDVATSHLHEPLPDIVGFAVSLFLLWFGNSLRRLAPWARVVQIILSSLLILVFLAATTANIAVGLGGVIYNIYLLCRVTGEQAKMIFSPEYKDVIAQTRTMKQRTGKVTWVVLVVLLAFLAVLLLSML